MANVLVLVSYKVFPAELGGQKAVTVLYQYLSRHHTVHMVVSADNELLPNYSVERILHPHSRMWSNVFKLFQLKKICKERHIQLVIAEHSYTGWLAYLLKIITGIPFIIRSHNLEASRFRQMKRPFWKLYSAYEKWIHKRADHNFFISEEDKISAVKQFKLSPAKCEVLPYGINKPSAVVEGKKKLAEMFGIKTSDVFYFNGTLDYFPNKIAVENLIGKLNPILQSKALDYTIIISGKDLSQELTNRINQSANIVYVGFVEDVKLLYQSASIFLNPVMNNAGIKTKVVEALANHCKVVSMKDGASGIGSELYGNNMVLAENGNWTEFAEKILVLLNVPPRKTPDAFFDYFSADRIAKTAADKINVVIHANF